jgi:ribosomal protein L11 methyltransferase
MYRAAVTLPALFDEYEIARLAEGFEDLMPIAHSALRQGGHRGDWRLELILQDKPEPGDLQAHLSVQATLLGYDVQQGSAWAVEAIDTDTDWLQECYRAFPPFSVGPFFIYGSHYQEGVPDGQMGLQIDAATAFGSGEHGTTKGCLQAMLDMKGAGQCPWNVLDMGCGSGILAIAAWKLWKTPILAVDIDPESVRVSAHHAELNGVKLGGSCLTCAAGDGFATPLVGKKAPFDLIIANILAGPLIEMAADLAAVSDQRGYVILSGMLQEQAAEVLAAYESLGFTCLKRYDNGEWTTLKLQKH